MRCAGCHKELEVGDRYIRFTASEWAGREGKEPNSGLDDVMAMVTGSGHGDKIVYCDDCTDTVEDGWHQDTYWGDEDDD